MGVIIFFPHFNFNLQWGNVIVFPSHLAFWINTVCPPWGARFARANVFHCQSCAHCSLSPSLSLSSVSRCISEPVVPAGDHLWSCSLQRLPLCLMEVVLGATERPLPPRCPQGGTLPGRRPTARPHRGKEEGRLTFKSESYSEQHLVC